MFEGVEVGMRRREEPENLPQGLKNLREVGMRVR
jgi:hypothetical protein